MRHWPKSYANVFLFVFMYVMIIILMVPSVEKTNMRHWPRRYASICSPLLLQALSCHMEQIMPSTLRKLKSVVGSYKNKIWLHSFTIGYKVAFIFRYVLFLSSGFWDRNPNINTKIRLHPAQSLAQLVLQKTFSRILDWQTILGIFEDLHNAGWLPFQVQIVRLEWGGGNVSQESFYKKILSNISCCF